MMRKRKNVAVEKKQKDSAVSIIPRRKQRPQKENNDPAPQPPPPTNNPTAIRYDDYGTTTAYGGMQNGELLKPAPPPFKSQSSPISARKQKMKKKIKTLKRPQENENEVGESDYKQVEKPSARIQTRKQPSKGTQRKKKSAPVAPVAAGEDSKKERKEDVPSRRPTRNIKVCSDELCISSDLNHNVKPEEGVPDERSMAEKPVAVDGRIDWVQGCYAKRVKGIVKEFSKAKDYFPMLTFSSCNSHENKNRYADVLCADETRVVLKNRESADDYIHASWVCCPAPNSQRFICAQGPMEDSIIDFWQMVFQEKTPVIVMLCAITENGLEKCAQYWPPEVGNIAKHGDFKLKNEKIEATDIDTIKCTTLKLENLKPQEGEEATLSILHYQWAEWPDHVSPAEPGPAVELLKVVKEKAKKAPIVVHCSAGIGRTGTFCGIDYANDRIKNDSKVQMTEILQELRRQRVHSVQSNPQYVYIHLCLIHLLMETKVVFESDETKQFFADYKRYMDAVRQKATVGKSVRNRRSCN